MFTRTIQKKNLPGSRFQKWSRELALKVCFTCYFWYLVLRRKNVAFFRCYIQGTQNKVSIFIFFYKTPRDETVVLCRRIARPSFQTATNRITIEESRQKNSRNSGIPQCQKCRCTQTRFLGWKDKGLCNIIRQAERLC